MVAPHRKKWQSKPSRHHQLLLSSSSSSSALFLGSSEWISIATSITIAHQTSTIITASASASTTTSILSPLLLPASLLLLLLSSSSSSSSSSVSLHQLQQQDELLFIIITQLKHLVQQQIQGTSVVGGPLIIMTFVVAMADAVPFLPTQPISIIAGALFGFTVGLPAVMLGQVLGTFLALMVGRYLLAPLLLQHDVKILQQPSKDNIHNNKSNKKEHNTMTRRVTKVLNEILTSSGLKHSSNNNNNKDDGDENNNNKKVFWTIVMARQLPVRSI